jgi:hypothetical protein
VVLPTTHTRVTRVTLAPSSQPTGWAVTLG